MTVTATVERPATVFDLLPYEKDHERFFIESDLVRTIFRGNRRAAQDALGRPDARIPNPHDPAWRDAGLHSVAKVHAYLTRTNRAAVA